MPPTSWKQESTTAIQNKLSFIVSTFVLPYLDDPGSLLKTLGLDTSTIHQKGIVRFRYDHNEMSPVTRAGMDMFFETTRAVVSKRVMPTVEDQDTTSAKYAYEYVGYLRVPEKSEYTFGVNSDDSMDVFVNRQVVADWYGTHSLTSATNIPGGNQYTVTLEPGHYPIRVRYVKTTGNNLALLWKTPAMQQFEIIGCDMLYHDPTVMNRDVSVSDTEFNENDIIGNILDYDKFIQYFGVMQPEMSSKVREGLGNILISQNNATYNSYTSDSTIPSLSLDGNINGDINYSKLLSYLSTVPNGNRLTILLDFLNGIRAFYYIMDDEVLENLKAGNEAKVAAYTLQNGQTLLVDGKSLVSTTIMEFLKKFTRVEYFIFRRLLLLLDLVIHSHISMRLFQTVYSTIEKTADEPKISSMIVFFVSRLKRLNSNFGQMFEAGQDSSVISNLYGNIRDFNKKTEQINIIDEKLRESKIELKARKDTLNKEQAIYQAGKSWVVISLVITTIVILTLFSYGVLSQTNPSLKWVGAGGVLVISSLLTLLIYLVKRKKLEGFQTGVYNATNLSDLLSSQQALDIITDAYQIDTIKEINAYIQNTISLALILQNNNTYKYINHNLNKELNYYNSTKTQMDNASASIRSSERMYNLSRRYNLSRINMFIALIVILTFGVVGYILADGYKTIQNIVMTITSILLLIVAILYILDTQSKVRTDGSKVYWGKPDELLQKL